MAKKFGKQCLAELKRKRKQKCKIISFCLQDWQKITEIGAADTADCLFNSILPCQ